MKSQNSCIFPCRIWEIEDIQIAETVTCYLFPPLTDNFFSKPYLYSLTLPQNFSTYILIIFALNILDLTHTIHIEHYNNINHFVNRPIL
jgi:hypothetical protein